MNITAEQLHDAYEELFPDQKCPPDERESCIKIYGSWLSRCKENPGNNIATTNWYGKCTKALFRALKIKQPRTKTQMLEALRNLKGE